LEIEEEQIFITADPVLRIDPVPLELGKEYWSREGFQRKEECKGVDSQQGKTIEFTLCEGIGKIVSELCGMKKNVK
jgi:hypothetical protein